jgi:hypothetical protein
LVRPVQYSNNTGCPIDVCQQEQDTNHIPWNKYHIPPLRKPCGFSLQSYRSLIGKRPREIWYSWVNKFSYFLNPHAINVLLYRMKPRKHIHIKYCWQTYFKSIGIHFHISLYLMYFLHWRNQTSCFYLKNIDAMFLFLSILTLCY